MSLAERVRSTVNRALERLADEGAFGPPAEARLQLAQSTGWTLERPKRAEHGDLATNVAMTLTKKLGKPPRVIAEALVKALADGESARSAGRSTPDGDDVVKSAEIAGPGFVNLRVHPRALHEELASILRAGAGYG